MANRREVLHAGLAVPAVSFTGLSGLLGSRQAGATQLEIECFVSDERYAESVLAARAAERQGFAVHATAGDMTALWYHRLDKLWKLRRAAVAGVTGEDALFVLERLGWDRGLRVVYRGCHAQPEGGRIRHELAGAEEVVRTLVEARPGEWPVQFARALRGCTPDVASHAKLDLVTTGPASGHARDDVLVSWLIASSATAKARS